MAVKLPATPADVAEQLLQHGRACRAAVSSGCPPPTCPPSPRAPASGQTLFAAAPQPPAGDSEQRRHELTVAGGPRWPRCKRCPELWSSTRTQTVFGVGPARSRPVLRRRGTRRAAGPPGRAVGRREPASCSTRISLAACGLKARGGVDLQHPRVPAPGQPLAPSRRGPPTAANTWSRPIDLVRPSFCAEMGRLGRRRTCWARQMGITRLHSKFLDYRGIPVMCTFHPSYLLRSNRRRRRTLWEDMKRRVLARIGRPVPGKG